MSNTPKTQPDADAIDASISVLGEEGGEAKTTPIDRGPGIEQAGAKPGAGQAQEALDAPISESEGAGRESVERPANDPDRV